MAEPIEIFTSDSDAWDDSALIKAWDSTIDSFKSELLGNGRGSEKTSDVTFVKPTSNSSTKKKSHKKRNKKKKTLTADHWQVGERCHAKYSDDGIYYTADIVALCDTFATVLYIDYDEEGDVMLSDLKKMPANTPESTTNDYQSHQNMYNNWNQFYPSQPYLPMQMPPPPPPCPIHHHTPYNMPYAPPSAVHSHGPIPQPPCPPHPFSSSKCSDESLAAMLMSWYKTGFSTGYYQALREHNIVPKDNVKVPR